MVSFDLPCHHFSPLNYRHFEDIFTSFTQLNRKYCFKQDLVGEFEEPAQFSINRPYKKLLRNPVLTCVQLVFLLRKKPLTMRRGKVR